MNFADLFEAVAGAPDVSNQSTDPLQADRGTNSIANVYIKLSPEVWQQFAELANSDPQGLADMLGLNSDQTKNFHQRIAAAGQAAERDRAEKSKGVMMPTGQQASPSSQEPAGLGQA